MLVRIAIAYDADKKFVELGREKYLELREAIPNIHLPEWPEGKEKPEYYYDRECYIEFETDGPLLSAARIEFTVKNFKQNYFVDQTFDKTRHHRGDKSSGSPVHVHIPNIGLLMIDEVTWMEDACTQKLQSNLDDGWRILAVCPPNGVRRPDYILGRTRKERS